MPKKQRKVEGLAERLAQLGAVMPPQNVRFRPEVLLCPPVPKPLHTLAPRVVLGRKWWDATRQKAYASTNWHCIACGVSRYAAKYRRWMEGHELYEVDYLMGRSTYLETVPLCHACHAFVHPGRLEAMAAKGLIDKRVHREILEHGLEVLRRAKIKKPAPYNGPFAEWGDWRLVIDGKEYPSPFKNEAEWFEHHNPLKEE